MDAEQTGLPKPSEAIYQERIQLENLMHEGNSEQYSDRYLEIMNGYDWQTKLFSENGKYGLKKWDGTLLLPAVFENFRMNSWSDLSPGDRVVAIMNDKEGVALTDGVDWKWILEPEFDYISYPNAILAVNKGGKWGIMDLHTSQYLVPLDCDEVYLTSGFLLCNGIGMFRIGEKYGVMNDAGEFTEALFDDVDGGDSEGPVKVKIGSRWGYINAERQFEEDEEFAHFYWDMG